MHRKGKCVEQGLYPSASKSFAKLGFLLSRVSVAARPQCLGWGEGEGQPQCLQKATEQKATEGSGRGLGEARGMGQAAVPAEGDVVGEEVLHHALAAPLRRDVHAVERTGGRAEVEHPRLLDVACERARVEVEHHAALLAEPLQLHRHLQRARVRRVRVRVRVRVSFSCTVTCSVPACVRRAPKRYGRGSKSRSAASIFVPERFSS